MLCLKFWLSVRIFGDNSTKQGNRWIFCEIEFKRNFLIDFHPNPTQKLPIIMRHYYETASNSRASYYQKLIKKAKKIIHLKNAFHSKKNTFSKKFVKFHSANKMMQSMKYSLNRYACSIKIVGNDLYTQVSNKCACGTFCTLKLRWLSFSVCDCKM